MFDLDSFYREAFSDLAWLFEDEEPGAGVVTYMRPPSIPDDEPEQMTTMQIVMLYVGADLSGLTASPAV